MTTHVLGTATGEAPKTPAPPWIPDDGTFGARLALIRQRMAWGNVKQAAEACGLPPESWRTWERDGVEPRGKERIAAQIADRTGCNLVWLIGGSSLIRLAQAGGAHNIRSVGLPNRPPARRDQTAPPTGVSAERSSQRRPQRVGAGTRPVRPMTPRTA